MATRAPVESGYRFVLTASYVNWRKGFFATTPVDVGGSDPVYGILMDLGMADEANRVKWALSTAVFANGSAAIKPTLGGGIDDLGSKMGVGSLAQGIVHTAPASLVHASACADQKIPEPGWVYCYFLTASGVLRAEAALADLGDKNHPLRPLFSLFRMIYLAARVVAPENEHDLIPNL